MSNFQCHHPESNPRARGLERLPPIIELLQQKMCGGKVGFVIFV